MYRHRLRRWRIVTGIPGCWRCLCLLVKIVGENAWLVHTIRHLRRRCAHTIATQQGMEISLRSFPFPTVLSIIYRLRRIPDYRFPVFAYSRGGGHNSPQQGMEISLRLFPFPTVLSIIYCLRRIPITDSRFSTVLRRIPGFRFTISVSMRTLGSRPLWH